MKFAIVESGGKQYRAVEGAIIDVDRLAQEVGKTFDFERVLLVAENDNTLVGTPIVGGVKVSATVLAHVKGPKVVTFRYRPKKRIRVKSGYRHQFTRLLIDFIGKAGEERQAANKESVVTVQAAAANTEAGVEEPAKAQKEAAKPSSKGTTPAAKKPTAAKKSAPKSSAKK